MSTAHVTLEDLLENLIASGTVPAAIRAHTDACPTCDERLALASRIVGAASVADIDAPSDLLVTAAWKRITRARALDAAVEQLTRARTFTAHALAALVGDSTTPSHAVRGQTTAHARVLVYETDHFGISLAIGEPTERGVAVRGQLTPRDRDELPAERNVVILAGGESREASIDDFGGFDLGTLPAETIHLAFTVGATRVDLPPLEPGGDT